MAAKILLTSALPYANGPLHIGHMVEFVQADVYARFLRSAGEDVIYVCADDTHGTPIELNAAAKGMRPEQFIEQFFVEHQRDLRDFQISVDYFHSTNSPENQHYATMVYDRLKQAGQIDRREIEQTYCETDRRFLPDRFVLGACPNCQATDQYGDVCEKCGKTYAPTDLIAPRCRLCGTPPKRKKSEHLFFRLSNHADFLLQFIRRPEFLHPGLAAQLQQFFEKGLSDWDISRDGPYFGFPIPGEQDKYFYVWLDAPIGYIATTEKWAKVTGKAKDALAYWSKDSGARIVHIIGKDILYFHALFWPATLKVADLRLPDRLIVHGMLTVNGEKMSKSRGTLVAARAYLDALDPSYLRYLYASNLGPGPEDFDFSLKDFRLRVNGELVNNFGNLANRALSMLAGPLDKRLAPASDGAGKKLVEEAVAKAKDIRVAYERLELKTAVKLAVEISASANQFLQQQKPWETIKSDPERARRDLSDAAEVAYVIAGVLEPVVPAISEKLFAQLQAPALTFAKLAEGRYPLLDRSRPIGTPAPLIARLEEAQVDAVIQAPAAESAPRTTSVGAGAKAASGAPAVSAPASVAVAGELEYADFAKVTLKVGKVLAAERVPKADKLLRLTVDIGEGSPRTIAAGIAEAYAPEQVQGRQVVVVANLKPRAIRGIESRGMLLAAGQGGKELSLVDPGPLPPGTEVK